MQQVIGGREQQGIIPAGKFSWPRSVEFDPWQDKSSQSPQRPGFPIKLHIKGYINQNARKHADGKLHWVEKIVATKAKFNCK